MELMFWEISCIWLLCSDLSHLGHRQSHNATELQQGEQSLTTLKGMIPSQKCGSNNTGVNPYCFFSSLHFHCLALGSHRKNAAEEGDQSPGFPAGDSKRESQGIRTCQRYYREKYRDITGDVPRSGILTFGLPSQLLVVDLIPNSKPTALRFALSNRSLPRSQTEEWVTRSQDRSKWHCKGSKNWADVRNTAYRNES